jgi:hypothetical protein
MSTALSPADRWRRYRYLQNVAFWLDPMPGRRRRAVLRELRQNLDAAAVDSGMARAVADLGSSRLLARQFLEAEQSGRPSWYHGALAATVVLAAWLYATMFYALGMLDALEATGTTAPAEGSFLGTHVSALFTEQQISAGFSGPPWAPLLVMVLAFLLASRAWRALPRRGSAQVPAAG